MRVLPALFPLVLAVSGAAQTSWPQPVLDAPMAVLSNNSYAMIEVLDHDGSGVPRALGVRVDPGPSTSFLTVNLLNLQTQGTAQLFAAYQPTVGAMLPRSAKGQIGVPDAGEEFVLAVGARVLVFDNYTLTQNWAWTAPVEVLAVAIGDFDGDGAGDVAELLQVASGVRQLVVRKWIGTQLALVAQLTLPANAGALLLPAETNGDNRTDLVVVGDRVQCYRYDVGVLTLVHDVFVGAAMPMPVAGDIDQDLDIDLVVFDTAQYTVLRRTGPATFAVEPPVFGGPATHLYDIDDDGDLDGVCCSSGGGSPPLGLYSPMTYHVSVNDNGTFLPAYELRGIGGFHLAGVADVDGNGHKDLIAGRTIYFAQQSLGTPPHAAGPGAATRSQALVDADGDGDVDALLAPGALHDNSGDGAMTVRGLALLTPPAAGTTYAAPVLAGDFDGDGDADLIVEVRAGGVPVGTRLLLQRGSAFADSGEPFPAGTVLSPWLGSDANAAIAADLDADGDVDLAISSTGGALFALLWHNDGAGHFASTAITGFTVKAVAELTGDAYPDLLVSDGRLLLRRGQANGSFAAAEPLTSQSWPYFNAPAAIEPFHDGIAVGDWTGDGRLDVIAAERSGGAMIATLLVNQGGAVPPFATGSLPTIGMNTLLPAVVIAGDVDGDGQLDVALGNPHNAHVDGTAVLFGIAAYPYFDAARTQQLLVPASALADLDADGDLDVVGEKVVRGNTFAGPGAGHRTQWGTGSAGVGGIAPLLGADAPIAVGHPLTFRSSGTEGLTCGLLALGTSTWNIPLFGGTSYVNPIVTLLWCADGAAGVAGDGKLSLVLPPLAASLARQEFHLQAAFLDSTAGLTLTNGLTVRIGD